MAEERGDRVAGSPGAHSVCTGGPLRGKKNGGRGVYVLGAGDGGGGWSSTMLSSVSCEPVLYCIRYRMHAYASAGTCVSRCRRLHGHGHADPRNAIPGKLREDGHDETGWESSISGSSFDDGFWHPRARALGYSDARVIALDPSVSVHLSPKLPSAEELAEKDVRSLPGVVRLRVCIGGSGRGDGRLCPSPHAHVCICIDV